MFNCHTQEFCKFDLDEWLIVYNLIDLTIYLPRQTQCKIHP